ncbi:MAG TPA: cytochrome c biogenesis protein CcsA [Acidimicrobiales bacterium]|nr:cytochrome c biogenesis protein CcsA [Acidimicrobiales bacterium]
MTATPTATPTSGSPSATTRPEAHPGPIGTGSRATRVIGVLALLAIGLLALYGLVISPADVEMGDSVRLYYVHVPSAICLALGCVVTTFASALWLRRRTAGWDALAEAGGEVALVFAVITLLTGSLWGRPTWGTYWTWDARLTSTAVLTALLVGYLAVRRLDVDPDARSVRAAVLGLLLLPNFVIVNRSVEWWRSLHQESTLLKLDPTIEGDMLVALMVGYVAFGLVFTWLMIHRFRVAWLEQQADRVDLDAALAARRAEGSTRTTEPPPLDAPAPAGSPAADAPTPTEVTSP